MESFATPYPVIFYDGEQDHDKGHVGVHSVLTFKRFQALMAQKTGLPANQLSSVFVCCRTLKDTEKRQKLPINENTNFNIILNQHNPSRERDCHFLVSMKKSKKERKNTRKRSAETDNADDDDSTSSRGDLSPSCERPKDGGTDETFPPESPEAASPLSFIPRSLSPTGTTASIVNGQKTSTGSPNGKLLPLGVAEYRAEKTLLRREGAGQNASSGWGAGAMSKRVEGFSVSQGASKVEIHTMQNRNKSAFQLEDRRKLDKHWRQSSPDLEDNGTPRSYEKANNGRQPHRHHSSTPDLFHLDRFSDAISQGHGMRPPSAVPARLNGVPGESYPALERNSTTLPSPENARPTIPSISSTARTFIPRVSMGCPAVVASTNGGFTLQQAQAHISHLQQHLQTPLAGTSQIELSKLNGMLRGLVGRDNRGENVKICKFCRFLRERNIGPPPFHWCVDDTITKGFSGPSPAGPIGRPVKQHVQAAA